MKGCCGSRYYYFFTKNRRGQVFIPHSIMLMSKQTIRVLVVDDHKLVAKSIKNLLELEPDIQVVGVAENGRAAIQLAQAEKPDVIVMDISMPELDGIRAAAEIKALGISARIIMLSMHHSSALVQQARKNGASGYVIKQQATSELIPLIRAIFAGTASL
jgi:DNA-binding NarL/FixJ family response regulator